jgi:TolA-binding protein
MKLSTRCLQLFACCLLASLLLLPTTDAFAQEEAGQTQGTLERKAGELGRQLDDLEGRLKEATGEARADLRQQLAELRTKQGLLRQRLKELQGSSGMAWQEFRTGAENALDELEKATSRALKQFRRTD